MKAVVAIALASLLVFSGCGKIQSEKLPGSWELTRHEAYFKSKAGESHTEKEVSHDESFLYVFDQGKMYIPGRNAKPVYQASYQLDGDKLVLQGQDQTTYDFKINELGEDKLKLEKKSQQGETEERIVLTFNRIGGFNNRDDNQPQGQGQLQPGQGNRIPQQPYSGTPNTRMPAPTNSPRA